MTDTRVLDIDREIHPQEHRRGLGRSGARRQRRPWGLYAAGAFVFLFIYGPIAVLVLFSFNSSSVSVWPLRSMSLVWYRQLAHNGAILAALHNSLVIGVTATLSAMVLGTAAAYAAHRFRFPGRAWLQRVSLMPMVLPGIVTGVALLTLFDLVHLQLSLITILLGHITFLIAIFFTSVFARLDRLGANLERAAMDLGASEIRAFARVILPNLVVTLVGAGLLAFALSFDEVQVTFFLTGTSSTLPILIYASMHMGLSPVIEALAATILFVSVALGIVGAVVTSRETRRIPQEELADAEWDRELPRSPASASPEPLEAHQGQ
jgi:spermidine/putrescine transport system permease protein